MIRLTFACTAVNIYSNFTFYFDNKMCVFILQYVFSHVSIFSNVVSDIILYGLFMLPF